MRLALSILGRTFALALTVEDADEAGDYWSEQAAEPEPIAVTGTPSSVEFGFAPVVDDYWFEEDRTRRRR
jgi:hypothetical protein